MAIFGRTGEVQMIPLQPVDVLEKTKLKADIKALLKCLLLKKDYLKSKLHILKVNIQK